LGKKVQAEIIMGCKHDKLLGYLDGEIVMLSMKNRRIVVAGTLMFAFNFAIKALNK